MNPPTISSGESQQPFAGPAPRNRPPPGACDCHVHICDATEKYPVVERAPYSPPHATFEMHSALRAATGFERSVAVQIVAYGENNELLVEALLKSDGTMRGVAAVGAGVDDTELDCLHEAGVRGLRFYLEVPKSLPGVQAQGAGIDDLFALAPRMKALNWIAEISASSNRISELAPRLENLGLPIVLEHLAGCAPEKGIDDPDFKNIRRLLRTGIFWIKLTCGMSSRPPDYEDLKPILDEFIAAMPERLVWDPIGLT